MEPAGNKKVTLLSSKGLPQGTLLRKKKIKLVIRIGKVFFCTLMRKENDPQVGQAG
jgi:hypothetical protein